MKVEGKQYPINDYMISNFEKKYNISLPNDYKEFLKVCNGGKPIISYFTTQKQENSYILTTKIREILPLRDFKANNENRTLSLELYYIYFTLGNRVPKSFMPIALTMNRDLICLSIDGKDKGKVFWCDLDWANEEESEKELLVKLINNSFREFLDNLFEKIEIKDNPVREPVKPQEKELIVMADINEIEAKYSINLPKDYKDFLLKRNGEPANDKIFKVKYKSEYVEFQLDFFFSITDKKSSYFNLEENYEYYMEEYSGIEEYFPISMDPGGNYFCISLNDEDYNSVYFISHNLNYCKKEHLILIANTFEEFLKISGNF